MEPFKEIGCCEVDLTEKQRGYVLSPQEDYGGLKRKYIVLKSDSGEPVENCFVLRPEKDKAAVAALIAYAGATDNKLLAQDIFTWLDWLKQEGET